MKKHPILLLILCALPFMAMTPPKSATVKWGPEIEGSRRGSITNTLGYDDTGYYIRGFDKGDLKIQKLNTKLAFVAEYTFEEKDPETKIKYQFEGVKYFNDQLFVFQSTTLKGDKLRELFVQELNKSSMKPMGTRKKITELTYSKNRQKGYFDIYSTSSDDKNGKLMIVIGTPTEKDEKEKFTIIMCDTELKTIWKNDFEMPYDPELFSTGSMRCDSKGNAYTLGTLWKEKKERERKKQNYAYHIMAFTNNGENTVDYEIKLDDKFVTDITYSITDDGNIVVGGYYSKTGKGTVDGAYYLMMDANTKAIKSTSVKEFDIDFITQGMTEREESKARKKDEKGKDQEIFSYDVRELIRRSDGGVILVGEQYFVTVTTSTNGRTTTRNYHYHYNNIIIVNIDAAGKIEWAQTISKRQRSTNDNGMYSSFAIGVTDDKLRFIFNDSRENLTPKKQGQYKNYTFRDKNGIVTLVTVEKDGTMNREALINDADIEVGVRPKVCDQINGHEILLFGERGKTDQFAIVTFPE